jgi:hypothetical protein
LFEKEQDPGPPARSADILHPRWIDRASVISTAFLLWFGFSQFGMPLYGLTWRC